MAETTELDAVDQSSTPSSYDDMDKRVAVESNVRNALQDIFGDEGPRETPEPAPKIEPEAEIEAEPEAAQDAVEPEPESPLATDEPEPAPEPEAAEETASPTLPAAYRRSLKAREWTDDEIDGFLKASPDSAMKTFERIHQSRVAEIEQWAKLGREAKKPAEPAPEPERKQAPVAGPSVLAPIDEEKLIQQYGNEEVIRAIVGPVNQVLASVNQHIPVLQAAQQAVEQQRQDALGKLVDDFLSSSDMKPYSEFYGSFKTGMSEGQRQNFDRMIELADAMVAGAAQQNRRLTVDEALAAAHASVSAGYQAKAVRDELKKTVTKRGSSLSLKPGVKRSTPGSKPGNRSELETRVRSGLREVFG